MEIETLLKTKTVRAEQTAATACRAAKELENIGEYDAARNALTGFWKGIGSRPRLEDSDSAEQAELLLRAGTLTGWLGSSGQVADAQQLAKDFVSESVRAFEKIGDREKMAEAETDLAICYWREGAMDEARVWFQSALSHSSDPTNQLRILVNSTTVEVSTNHLNEAVSLLERATPLLNSISDEASLGRFYMQRAIVFRRLGGAENLDRSLMDHTAASIHFERANHRRYFARVKNNIGIILLELARYDDALNHLEEARQTLVELGDIGTVAQINETRARVYLAQGRYADAEKLAYSSASALSRGGEKSLLAEALETQGVALARQGRYQSALAMLKRAGETAEAAGDSAASGRTFLTILEELRSFLAPHEIGDLYHQADSRLGEDLSHETIRRLRASARFVIGNVAGIPRSEGVPATMSFEEEVRRRESELIKRALEEANGSVTRAAKTLGLTHQGLCYIINYRHPDLLTARAPIRVRRKSLMKK